MTATALETKAAFARRLGVNKSTITRAGQEGRLIMQDGKVDVAASLARWHATAGGRTDLTEKYARQRSKNIPHIPTPIQVQENAATGLYSNDRGIDEEEEAQTNPDRTRYKTMVLHFENQTIKLHMALDKGLRHRLAAVQREALGLGAALQASVERLIDQTAPRLAAATGRDARATLLRDECGQLARVIRAEFVRSARRLRTQGGNPQKASGSERNG